MFLAGYNVAMLTYCVAKIIATCSPMIGQFLDAMIVVSSDKELFMMTHQNPGLGNCLKPF